MRVLAASCLALLLLAGCSSPSTDDAPAVSGPQTITRPDDFVNGSANAPHIHDYWGGSDRLTVVDLSHPGGDEPGTGPGLASGQDVVVRTFQPDALHVVPQGSAVVEVTFTWTDDQLDAYVDPVLWMKTAGQNASQEVASLVNGEPVTVEVGLPDADLPHQLLSAWVFELRMSSPDPMPLRFKGAVALKVDALRGLPLPVFPPHRDFWNGAAELPLVEGNGMLAYFQDVGDGGCNGMSCPQVFRPASGLVVPQDAYLVRATLDYSGPWELELHYHSGLERGFLRADPVERAQGHQVFEILVDGGGDGPYATQSQWEFTVLPPSVGPLRSAWMADYTLEAVAVK